MPYRLKKVEGGFQVESEDTGKVHSNHPLSKERASAQMRAMYANVPDASKHSKAPSKRKFKGRKKEKK
jgi:hypothetical protein